MEQKEMQCPVCGQKHEASQLCPQCGYEYHLMLVPPAKWLEEAEQRRLNEARARWQQQQESTQKALEGQQPLGFLITSRLAVYCLYEGRNVFGAPGAQSAEGEHYQELTFPGVSLCQRHFAIDAAISEDGRKVSFMACLLDGGISTVCINSQAQTLTPQPTPVGNNDNIILCPGNIENNVELKLRKNLNR